MKCTIYVFVWHERSPEAIGTVVFDARCKNGRVRYNGAAESFLRERYISEPGLPGKRLEPSDGERYLQAIPHAFRPADQVFAEVIP